MHLSVIILNYKVPFYLLQCIWSVKKAVENIESEIIVVDNNSEDESCTLVKKHFPEVILIENTKNGGFSKGNNQGVKIARGKYICLLNPDTVVSETVFEKTLLFAEKHEHIGALGVKLIDGRGFFLPESKRNLPTPQIAFQKLIGNSSKYYSNLGSDKEGEVDILVGAFMLMRKDRYIEVGGLDEDYFMYGEDIDLSYKFLKFGYKNYYVGSETVLHYKGESTNKDKIYRKRFYGAMQIFYHKHFKQNFFLNSAVTLALQMAKLRHSFSSAQSEIIDYKQTYWVSKDEKTPRIEGVTFNYLNPEKISTKKINNSLFVFDSKFMALKKIFSIMENQKKGQNYFRIKPTNFNFIIGSDSNTGKGDVIKI
ncbi:glycosyltransferase family 2 protein [Mesonia aquimarina]|uniref:glycosyltransferase family 2 protein n=1 Tax=Mesonia aquimarina TaxID=1504967 RepID=UPI000EF58FEC|nr:glycosyltransferase family 2 protein [Mesonia aquimarina]